MKQYRSDNTSEFAEGEKKGWGRENERIST